MHQNEVQKARLPRTVVVVGSVNADFIIHVNDLPHRNETVSSKSSTIAIGGKGLNQAVAAARMGMETLMIAATGDDTFGYQAVAHLNSRGVNTDAITKFSGVNTGMANILVANDGGNSIVVSAGANDRLTPSIIEAYSKQIECAGAVLLQLETPLETVRCALDIARRHNVLTVLNPAPYNSDCFDLLPLVDVLTPNESELQSLTGVGTFTDRDLIYAFEKLQKLGAKRVVATLGEKGCATLIDERLVRVPAMAVKAIDTTGAGDVFNGVLTGQLALGRDILSAMRFAGAASALSVTIPTADSSSTTEEILEFIESYKSDPVWL